MNTTQTIASAIRSAETLAVALNARAPARAYAEVESMGRVWVSHIVGQARGDELLSVVDTIDAWIAGVVAKMPPGTYRVCSETGPYRIAGRNASISDGPCGRVVMVVVEVTAWDAVGSDEIYNRTCVQWFHGQEYRAMFSRDVRDLCRTRRAAAMAA